MGELHPHRTFHRLPRPPVVAPDESHFTATMNVKVQRKVNSMMEEVAQPRKVVIRLPGRSITKRTSRQTV